MGGKKVRAPRSLEDASKEGSEVYHSHSVVLSRTAPRTRSIRSIAQKASLSTANRTASRAREGIPVPKDKGRESPCSPRGEVFADSREPLQSAAVPAHVGSRTP